MKIKKFSIILSIIGATSFGMHAISAEIESLRGALDNDQDARVPELKHYAKDGKPIARDYVQQPPLVPHKIDNYKINLKSNKCLSCHSWTNYRESGATKISQTHFADREEQVLANVSPRRYFCTQCHVPQVNAPPLVENTFKPVQAITGAQ